MHFKRPELRGDLPALVPGLLVMALMLLWAIQDGGYDPSTWYWGALVVLATLAAVLATGTARLRPPRATLVALGALALYVAWSYASLAWAGSPGDALQGSNRALLYLMVFSLLAILPWTVRAALSVVGGYALGVGVIAVVLLGRLASGGAVGQLFSNWRFLAPTGYFNATCALFTLGALMALALAARPELPGLLRGVFVAVAVAGLQLAVIGQSRGWLFTLPLVVIAAVAVSRDRIRLAVAATLAVGGTLLSLHPLLAVYRAHLVSGSLEQAARHAGHAGLLVCAGTLVVATLIAWAETLIRPRAAPVPRRRLLAIGTVLVLAALAVSMVGVSRVTHGDPVGFVKRQWNGFSHPAPVSTGASYFDLVGSGRYDFWRVSLDALSAHPLGGLGQDNFTDYYITRRHTTEEPQWTHSLEMRLLAHTGLVGTALFAVFLIAAVLAALRARRRARPEVNWLAGAALLPLIVWLCHGSVDWFWEMPALSGPALGFAAVAGALGAGERAVEPAPIPAGGRRRLLVWVIAPVAVLALAAVLGLPYLSVREVKAADTAQARNPGTALKDLGRAAVLNPLSAEPDRIAGALALQTSDFTVAEQRFRRAIARERGGWFAWLGDGLAASAIGDAARARHDYDVAKSINSLQPAVVQARADVDTTHPLTPQQAFRLLVVVG